LRIDSLADQNESVELRARLRYPFGRWDCLWFRVPARWRDAVTDCADPFVLAVFQHAMARRCDLIVEGAPVSAGLLPNLDRAQAMLHHWWPSRYRPVAIRAEQAAGQAPANATLAAFSGGVDSCYAVLRHGEAMGPAPHFPIDAAVLVHGFDVRLHHTRVFERAVQKAQRMLAPRRIPLILLSTNIRVTPHIWNDAVGGMLAGTLSVLSQGFGRAIVASSHERTDVPYGSHRLLDGLYSSDRFEVWHDGARTARLAKVEALASWPEAGDNIRVCWEGRDHSVNCGRCEKCLRTFLAFRVAGQRPAAFPADVHIEAVRSMKIDREVVPDTYLPLLETIRQRGIAEPWVPALEEAVARNMRCPGLKWWERIPPGARLRVRMWRHRMRGPARV
jgi:hypothetical protein